MEALSLPRGALRRDHDQSGRSRPRLKWGTLIAIILTLPLAACSSAPTESPTTIASVAIATDATASDSAGTVWRTSDSVASSSPITRISSADSGGPVTTCPDAAVVSAAVGLEVTADDATPDEADSRVLGCGFQFRSADRSQTLAITLVIIRADDPGWARALNIYKQAALECASGCEGKTESEQIEFDAYTEYPDGYEAVDLNFLEWDGKSFYMGGISAFVENSSYVCASLPLGTLAVGLSPGQVNNVARGIADLVHGMCYGGPAA